MCTPVNPSVAEGILRSFRDPFFPESELASLSASMQSAWQTQIGTASREAMNLIASRHGTPDRNEIGKILSIYKKKVSGSALTHSFRSDVNTSVTGAFHKAKREVNAEEYKQTKAISKDDFRVEIVEGMSEAEAIMQLEKQVVIAAGDFWDTRLQSSLEYEMKEWFSGELSQNDLTEKFKTLVNERLVSENKSTLGDTYFRQLAHNSIVKTRTVSKFGRAKELGAKGYMLINPMDARTSKICKTLVARKLVYPLEAAQHIVNDLLTETTSAGLKAKQPFWKSPDEDRIPFPPLHWGECRTTIRITFLLKMLNMAHKYGFF
jgi:hypothetical protein